MEIIGLFVNNIKDLSCDVDSTSSTGIGGLSGSGKSTFCETIYEESIRRVVTLLPKSEYRFLFPNCLSVNCTASGISGMPLVFYLKKNVFASNPRSTLGTHTGIFKKIRAKYAGEYNLPAEFFSFNNSLMWCPECKGRGSTAGKECKVCGGQRYSNDIKKYTINVNESKSDISDINSKNIQFIRKNASYFDLDDTDIAKLDNLLSLGLPYLSLDRTMSTLSGGESIRVLLSEFMAVCEGSLLILDEISTGLDRESLLNVLKQVSKLATSNQLWFIDHSNDVLFSTNKKIYFGPGSGDNGGKIVSESPRPTPVFPKLSSSVSDSNYIFTNLKKRNIDISEIQIPKHKITTITGESGCGKSTLVNDCIIPFFKQRYKKDTLVVIGQDRNQSITSKSTIASFLDLKKHLVKHKSYDLHMTLEQTLEVFKKDKHICPVLEMLSTLGLGYLSLDRKIQSLSTGEFQCIHLIEKLFELSGKQLFIILDEPSKGLSQNILNLFMAQIRNILSTHDATILIIEHNNYIINCSDYIIDFGKRAQGLVTKLNILDNKTWKDSQSNVELHFAPIPNYLPTLSTGIETITDKVDQQFAMYDNYFKGGLLKNFSGTAQWIYKDYNVKMIRPIIAIDFEKRLYSDKTFLFELCSTINKIVSQSNSENYNLFNFYNPNNLCECCKGIGVISTFDYTSMIVDSSVGLWDGLLDAEIMLELKRYNYSKIKFLFKEIKKESNLDLSKPFDAMSEQEKKVFLFGYWENTFYDAEKGTQRRWYGILHLIAKYLRSSSSRYKATIKSTSRTIACPHCNGQMIKHPELFSYKNNSVNELFNKELSDQDPLFCDIPQIKDFVELLGSGHHLNDDVSALPYERQAYLKVLELFYSSFSGYTLVLKNFAPYFDEVEHFLKKIAINNRIVLLDWDGIKFPKSDLLKILEKHKVKANAFVYEIFGYKKITSSINKIKKANCCVYCHGSGMFRDESIFEGVDVTLTPCSACQETGINKTGMDEMIEGIKISTWLKGTMSDVNSSIPDSLKDINPCTKISELNKRQLNAIIQYLSK